MASSLTREEEGDTADRPLFVAETLALASLALTCLFQDFRASCASCPSLITSMLLACTACMPSMLRFRVKTILPSVPGSGEDRTASIAIAAGSNLDSSTVGLYRSLLKSFTLLTLDLSGHEVRPTTGEPWDRYPFRRPVCPASLILSFSLLESILIPPASLPLALVFHSPPRRQGTRRHFRQLPIS